VIDLFYPFGFAHVRCCLGGCSPRIQAKVLSFWMSKSLIEKLEGLERDLNKYSTKLKSNSSYSTTSNGEDFIPFFSPFHLYLFFCLLSQTPRLMLARCLRATYRGIDSFPS
jgi:hypothetical protein